MILAKAVFLGAQLVTLVGAPDRVPRIDVEPVCKGIAEQGGVTFHDPSMPQEKKNCIDSEYAVRDQLAKQWSRFLVDDRTHCINETIMGGESSYTELLTCLEMARDVRAMRADAAARPQGGAAPAVSPAEPVAAQPAVPPPAPARVTANPPSPLPPPPPSSAATLPRSATSTDAANLELASLRKELDRAKTDAQSASLSEASAQRKLADAEAALRRTKEEADQAKDDARRAKADAQAAKESEAAEKRKLADAEAARAAAEKQCQSTGKSAPGFGAQLRKWFKGD
jgi:hypothetical protein